MDKGRVISARFISPAVRWFRLQSLKPKPEAGFKAGQWIDLLVPGTETVGGYSMCSTPSLYKSQGTFDLAIKQSDHPAAEWMHQKCEVGMEVSYKFGGEICFNETDCSSRPLLLLAGGIGINPLFSIMQRAVELNKQPVTLLYSSKTSEELIFKEDIDRLRSSDNNIDVGYFLTSSNASSDDEIKNRRMSMDDLQQSVSKLGADKLTAFICGPTEMIKDLRVKLTKTGVPEPNIKYELWE